MLTYALRAGTRGAGLLVLALLLVLTGLPAAPQAAAQSTASITVTPETAPQNSTVTLLLSGYRSLETVNIWQTYPDFTVLTLGDFEVDINGNAEIQVRIGPNVPIGSHAFSARGNSSRRLATATFDLTLGEGTPASDAVQVAVRASSDGPDGSFVFTGSGYESNERVSLWINLPDDTVEDAGTSQADSEGVFRFTLTLGSTYPEGAYTLTAFGQRSQLTGIVPFQLARGELPPPLTPVLSVSPPEARQFEIVSFIGENFGSNEQVSLWVTLENGVVVQLRETSTEIDGFFAFDYNLELFPVGEHQVTAQGKTSTLSAVTTFRVLPGVGPEE